MAWQSKYAVAVWMPDVVRGECMNIAVLAWDASGFGPIHLRTLKNWDRLRVLDPDIDPADLSMALLKWSAHQPAEFEAYLGRDSTAKAMSSLQWRGPHGSLLSPHDLAVDLTKRMLVEPVFA